MNNLIKTASLLVLASFSACNLIEEPIVEANKQMVFSTESAVEAYTVSFYNYISSLNDLVYMESGNVDYATASSFSQYYTEGTYNSEIAGSWSWSQLRNINYFLDALDSPECTINDRAKAHYRGIGRWFRANFYYGKLRSYGDCPWFEHLLNDDDLDEMYKDRESRDKIVGKIIEDLDYAAANIKTESSKNNTLISKYAAYLLKSRVCLFEGTFRKYHGLSDPSWNYNVEGLLTLAADAANEVIKSGKFSLNFTEGSKGAYRELFYNNQLKTNETILGREASGSAGVYNNANYVYNRPTTGNKVALSRVFVCTFLNRNGTRFTDNPEYRTIEFRDEFAGRDLRLAQIVRSPSYTMGSKQKAPDIYSTAAPTGYHIIKYSLDDESLDGVQKNTNSIPVMRYAEVLLNYAEAKAELGTMSSSDWTNTIGALRNRAGISNYASRPTDVDPFMQEYFYPNVTDPLIMEIRRERAIELCMEGFRMYDLRRWAEGHLYQDMPWWGIHVPDLDSDYDIDGRGGADIYFSYKESGDIPATYKNHYMQVYKDGGEKVQGLYALPNSKGGYDLEYRLNVNRKWYEDGRQYLNPINAQDIRDYAARGYHLTQNPNW